MNTEIAPETSTNIDYGKIVGAIAAMMKQEGALTTGELADLRRISPDQPFTPALWRILMMLELDESPSWISQGQWERRWATRFLGRAHCGGLRDASTALRAALPGA